MSNRRQSFSLSPAETLVEEALVKSEQDSPPTLRTPTKYFLLALFCLAQFLDAFNVSSLFSGIPVLTSRFDLNAGEATWIISAFQLTFASFLPVSGKVSDVYNPKHAFVLGSFALAVLSLGTGFVNDKIGLIVLRALGGISGSMTIPSALSMLVHVFPDPGEQARAISAFGGFGAIGNVLGLLIGAIFIQYASWRWIFWFVAIAAAAMSGLVAILAPTQPAEEGSHPRSSRLRRLDLPGVFVLTAALILLIFGVTSSTEHGWGSAMVLAPLIVSIAVFVAFFLWEARLPMDHAAIPSETWFYTNFSVLFGVGLFPFLWWTSVFTNFVTLWQDIYHWSVISTAVHLFPIGGIAFALSFSGSLSRVVNPRYLILLGHVLLVIGTVVLGLTDKPGKYASYAVPGFIIGSGGAMLVYTQTNIAIFQTAPPSMAGTVGAIFNSALQVGSAVGLAAVTSIQTSVDAKHEHTETTPIEEFFKGRAASFWFLLGLIGVEIISILIFYRDPSPATLKDSTIHRASAEETKDRKAEPA